MTHLASNNEKICFTKKDLRSNFSTSQNTPIPRTTHITSNGITPSTPVPSATLDSRIQRALKKGKLLQLKKGLYMTGTDYFYEPDKVKLGEYLASKIYQPSYISLEYVLEKNNLLSRPTVTSTTIKPPHALITSITTKPTHIFKNFSGIYRYTNIKQSIYIGNDYHTCNNNESMKTENNIYIGFEEHTFHGNTYHIATKAKAMFDYLYLNSTLDRRNIKHLWHQLFEESGIHWENFSEDDFNEFDRYVWESNSHKMMTVLRVINTYFENKKFDAWKNELLS